MSTPTPVKTWVISPNNRIVYVSLLDVSQRYLFGIKEFLKTNGWTVKGSASAGTGAMDGVDRWSTSASVTPRGTSAGVSQAWIVLTGGAGIDVAFCFQGATDDTMRIAFSPGGLYVAAGTPNQQPTATDEVVDHLAGSSTTGNQTSGDRLWNAWTSSDKKNVRVQLARGGVWQPSLSVSGKTWAIGEYTSALVSPWVGTPAASPIWMFSAVGANAIPNGTQAGRARLNGPNPGVYDLFWGLESIPIGLTTSGWPSTFGNEQPELQGGTGYVHFPLGIWCNSTGAHGKVGQAIDMYTSRMSGDASGDTYGSKTWVNSPSIAGTAGGGGLWPWDGVTTPVLT